MNAEKISEALSFIDDDIIEETDALRKRKKNSKSIWLRTLSAVACFCIVLMGVVGLMKPVDGGVNIGENPVEDFKYGSGKGNWCGGVLGALSVDEVAFLEITEWKGNCFYATAVDGENDAFSDGTKVKVKFSAKQVWVRHSNYSGWKSYDKNLPSAEDFEVGSKVFVIFDEEERRNTFLNSKADEVITAFVIECDGTERWR